MAGRHKHTIVKWIGRGLLYMFALLYLFPICIAVINSFKKTGEILASTIALPKALYLDNYRTVFTEVKFLQVFFNSVLITFLSIGLIIAVGALAGYAIARWRSRAANVFMLLFLSAMFVPFHTIMITLMQTASALHATGKFWGLILIYGALNCPIPIFLYRGFVRGLPIEMEESGVIDGCSRLQLMARIVFPLLKPISGTIAVINALWIWNDFLLPYLVLAKPVTIPLSQMFFYGQYNQQWNLIMAGFVISTLPIVIFFLAMQKYIIKGLVAGAIKG